MRVGIIGDVHEPASRPGYLEFCQETFERAVCDTIVFIGDLVDWHAISFHACHPDLPGPADEFELAKERVAKWYKAFPRATVLHSNHGDRPSRLAASVNIPQRLLKPDAELWETPGWNYLENTVIDGVFYTHGTGTGGSYPGFNLMKKMAMSCVVGHHHTCCDIKYLCNPERRLFGMSVGAGCDDKHLAMSYAKSNPVKSVLACGCVLDGVPFLFPMPIGSGERYNRTKWETKSKTQKTQAKVYMKACSKCNFYGPAHAYFHKDCTSRDGFKSQCKECRNEKI